MENLSDSSFEELDFQDSLTSRDSEDMQTSSSPARSTDHRYSIVSANLQSDKSESSSPKLSQNNLEFDCKPVDHLTEPSNTVLPEDNFREIVESGNFSLNGDDDL